MMEGWEEFGGVDVEVMCEENLGGIGVCWGLGEIRRRGREGLKNCFDV